jgi:hypothetical protein
MLVKTIKHYHDQYKSTLVIIQAQNPPKTVNSNSIKELFKLSQANLTTSLVTLFNESVESGKISNVHTAVQFQEKLISILDSNSASKYRLHRDLTMFSLIKEFSKELGEVEDSQMFKESNFTFDGQSKASASEIVNGE